MGNPMLIHVIVIGSGLWTCVGEGEDPLQIGGEKAQFVTAFYAAPTFRIAFPRAICTL